MYKNDIYGIYITKLLCGPFKCDRKYEKNFFLLCLVEIDQRNGVSGANRHALNCTVVQYR